MNYISKHNYVINHLRLKKHKKLKATKNKLLMKYFLNATLVALGLEA